MSSWKLTLPCTRAEAEAIDADDEVVFEIEPSPVLLTSEVIADDPLAWQLEAYFESKPNSAALTAVQALVPSSKGVKAVAEKIRDADWVTMSQAGIEPVHAGRFYVHTNTNKGKVPAGAVPFRIDAGLAFGTGTGLLAFAALHLWPRAYATASDIDARAVDVTGDNAEINGIQLGGQQGELALAAAAGVEHPLLIGRAPYDLVIANILAGPLIELAPSIGVVLAEGGTLILAGLLNRQAEDVAQAYRRQGLRLVNRTDRGDWPTLTLTKRVRYGTERVTRLSRGKGEAPGFGSW
jgi:ribosomal protein L11 methyltransferase